MFLPFATDHMENNSIILRFVYSMVRGRANTVTQAEESDVRSKLLGWVQAL
jgi:hypothetical protein